jgi:isopenicillin-N epimerase
VFEIYQNWQLELERQPVAFLGRRTNNLMDEVRATLAAYVHTSAENLAFITNVTLAINTIAKSMCLEPGDEVLTTNHEYGSMDATWTPACEASGAVMVRLPISLPVTTHHDFVEFLWSAVTPRTRIIFVSHITSPTGLIFPVAEICRRAMLLVAKNT